MKRRTCTGCGRLLAFRYGVECPCWRSHNSGALIPWRLASATHRIEALFRRGLSEKGADSEVAALRPLTEVVR